MDEHPMTKVWFLNKLVIVTKDADFIHKVFNSQKVYDKPNVFYQGFLVEKGLIVMSGAEHKRHRKILNKAFTSKMMQRLPDIFDEKSMKILDLLEERMDCGEFELTDYIGAYSFEAFGKSNFNYEINYYDSEIFRAYKGYCSLIVDTLPFLIVGLDRKFLNLLNLGKSLTKIEKTFDEFFDDVRKTNQEIAFETTTKTISTALMMLGMHKDVQQKAVNEIEAIYSQDANSEFSADFLQKFTYLELILKETMRLFAVAPIVARETSDEVSINGYLIPKNTTIIISINAMHRDEKYWGTDADQFRPERFEEELKNPHACPYPV
ncbi:probable cytochrome P450 313a4 [Chironomus tepperi]|uniref:probable cytochrome P450 313a4 n=1 Tax=Chironomus tepperi TaxID=113505 RepID=UPI00391F82E5